MAPIWPGCQMAITVLANESLLVGCVEYGQFDFRDRPLYHR